MKSLARLLKIIPPIFSVLLKAKRDFYRQRSKGRDFLDILKTTKLKEIYGIALFW